MFAGANTYKSQDTVTAVAGDNNRKYIIALEEFFDNLQGKLTNLKLTNIYMKPRRMFLIICKR